MEFRDIVMLLCIGLTYLIMLVVATSDIGGSHRDHIALLAFKSNIKHDPQGVMSSWNESLHFCNWQGVTCSHRHRRVTILNLRSRGLVGTLSPYVGNLSFLRGMILSNNTMQGQIPHEIGRLFRLENLRLTSNNLEGEIPANLFRCSNLVNLSFGDNKLVGKIPEELGSLSKLRILVISINNLTGVITPSIGNLTFLEILYASNNKLGGSIPDVFHRLKNLQEFGLGENELSGNIPPSLYNLSDLTVFSLSGNQLHGSLPTNFGLFFPHLQFLEIRTNTFTGPIPNSLSNASKLEHVEMSSNNFAGKVSVDFRGMKHLKIMHIYVNNLGTGEADDLKFVTSLLNCSNLKELIIGGNQFGGELPNSVGNFSSQIALLEIRENQISGRIPPWIGALSTLTFLGMADNQLIGPIPESLGKLHNLIEMHLYTNSLSGQIPSTLGNLSSLTILTLFRNRLEGTIPSNLGNCKDLLRLHLFQNSLSGTIPNQLFNISTRLTTLDLSQNHLIGSLPYGVGNLKNLNYLFIYKNELSGEIPNNLGDCSSLLLLYMDGNFFHGSIPQALSSLKGIQEIDLSRNNLSGEIPKFLENFDLINLNLSFNDFEGEIPSKGVFTNASALSILGNKRLCGGISELKLPSCPTKESKKKRNISSLAIILITIACSLLGVTFLSLFIYFRFKWKRIEQSSGSFKYLWKVSYAMLLKATDGFSPANLLGVGSFGSVYKGILNVDEEIVAIKVLNLQRRGASKSFMAECEALRNIRHRNLVRIITSCSSIDFQGNDFKALVYEFMPNGSLEMWLNQIPESSIIEDQLQNLNLFQRINIVIDVASALDYLHHHCQPLIVHCDLKPSNILLDGDMIAHLGDFGLAKFLQEFITTNQSSSIGIRGTIGYAAPEYGLGSVVSTSGDVYSFGIVLLEMMTGKKPTDGVFEKGHNLHNFARLALPDHVMEIVDPILLNNEKESGINNISSVIQTRNGNTIKECLISLVKIGVACSMESPQDRLDITSVVRELHLARGILQQTAVRT